MNKKTLFILLGIATLLFALLLYSFFSILKPVETITEPISPTIAQQPSPTNISIPSSGTNPPVIYTPGSFKKDLDRLQNRIPLNDKDKQAKKTLLQIIGNKSGILFSSSHVILRYFMAPDDIEGEILVPDVSLAKQEAETWLTTQGLSETGICDFPVTFYPNSTVANQLREANTTFNPNPDGC